MKYAIPILLLFACSGCFFKSDENGTADDIIREFLYTDSAGQVLIAHEKVFHATSKESGGGMTHVSGYSRTRVSAYDVHDGHLLARKVLGDEQDEASSLLTTSGNKLWYVTRKHKQFTLATMNPRTLEDIPLPATLLQQAPFLNGRLYQTDWFQLKLYFLYDATRGIVLNDDQGFRYTLNPTTLKVEKFNDPGYQPFFINLPEATSATATYDDNMRLQLIGNPRYYINTSPDGKTLENDPGYLNGRFLMDANVDRVRTLQSGQLQELQEKVNLLKKLQDSLKQLKVQQLSIAPGKEISSNRQAAIMQIGYRVDDLTRKAALITPHHNPVTTDRLLEPKPDNFFIIHASNGARDAQLLLSSLEWKPGQPLKQRWQTTLQDFFFDPNNARETNMFKATFSSGNPQFSFKWADFTQQELLLTWMLHTVCIDLQTGKVMWKIRH